MLRPDAQDHGRTGMRRPGRSRLERDGQRARAESGLAILGGKVPFDEIHLRRADKSGDKAVGRAVVDFERAADLLDHPVLHHHDAVPQGHRLDLVVGDVNHAGADLLVQLGDLVAHAHAQLGVQVRQRLVEQEDVGLAHHRPPQRDALHLAAGKLLGLAVEQSVDAEDIGGPAHPAIDLVLRDARHLQAEGQFLVDGLVRIERVVLEHHGHVARPRLQPGDLAAGDEDLPAGGVLEPGDHAKRRRLAAPRRADEHHELALGKTQARRPDGIDAAEPLLEILEDDVTAVARRTHQPAAPRAATAPRRWLISARRPCAKR